MQAPADDITGLLVSWREGNRAALDALLPLIQRELNQIARRHLGRERQNHSMQPSSLVQEAFLRRRPIAMSIGRIGRISSPSLPK